MPYPHLCFPIFAQQYPVWQAVIFLFEHDDKGSAGFILNKPTEHKLGKIVGADELCPEFADNLLYLGGDVGSDTMHFIHGYSDIQVSEAAGKVNSISGFSLRKCHVHCLLCAAAASTFMSKYRTLHQPGPAFTLSPVAAASTCHTCNSVLASTVAANVDPDATADVYTMLNCPKLVMLSLFNVLSLCLALHGISVGNASCINLYCIQLSCAFLCVIMHLHACEAQQCCKAKNHPAGCSRSGQGSLHGRI